MLVAVDAAECDDACQRKLWKLRQVRLTTGKERDRVERVFLITDTAPLQTMLLREYEGTLFLRADPAEVRTLLQPATPADLAAGAVGHRSARQPDAALAAATPIPTA